MSAPAYSHVHTTLPSAVFDEDDAVLLDDDWAVFLDESLERWEVYVDGVGHRVFVSTDTWESFDGRAQVRFQEDFIDAYLDREVREMRFIMTDAGVYAEAARKDAARQGTDVVRAKDLLTDLSERADGLIVQAASLNRTPTEMQLQVFAQRHARLVSDMAALEASLAQLRSKVELAGIALVDAAS